MVRCNNHVLGRVDDDAVGLFIDYSAVPFDLFCNDPHGIRHITRVVGQIPKTGFLKD